MAATYGYSGEFSSDEEIDKIEQQAERFGSKFDAYQQSRGPSDVDLKEAIAAIRSLEDENELDIADELLAAILDHYKTPRGPIVDSTRNLYKKIVLRLVRGVTANGDSQGNGTNNNNNNNNNSDIGQLEKRPPQIRQVAADQAASSDEDEPMLPDVGADATGKLKTDSRVTANNNDNAEPMDIDSVQPNGPMRGIKQIDLPTTDEEDNEATESESATEESSEEEQEDKRKADARDESSLPVKQVGRLTMQSSTPAGKTPTEGRRATTKSTSKSQSVEPAKKPYTRSQRVAATRLNASSTSSASVNSATRQSESAFLERPRRRFGPIRVALILVALLGVALGVFFYKYQSNYLK